MFYHRKLSTLNYDSSDFQDIIDHGESNSTIWRKGYDSNNTLWNINELPLDFNQFPILQNIYNAINLEFKRPSFYLSKVLPGGLPNHIDHRKWGNLGFPLSGDFEYSKINFHDQFNQIVETLEFQNTRPNYRQPFIINTRMTHSVAESQNLKNSRITLMLDLFEWPGHVFKKVDNGTLFSSIPDFFKIDNHNKTVV